jgi:hypothetical protein
LSLAFGKTSSYRRQVGCRLSDVQKNVYDAFVGGEWGADGWSNWVSVSQTNNNIYGTYISTNNSLLNEQIKKMGIAETELSWGNGFKPWRKCVKKDSSGKCQEFEKNARTPGSVIENQLNNTLGSTQRRIEVADEINEILDALMNQAIGKVFSSMGLLGMSEKSSAYSGSYLQNLTTTYEDELKKSSEKPPVGIDCKKFYKITTCDNTMRYPCIGESLGKKILTEYIENAFVDPTASDACTLTNDSNKKTGCFMKSPVQPSELSTMSSEALEDKIIRGCNNLNNQGDANTAINDALGSGTGGTTVGGGTGTGTGGAQQSERLENVALNRPVSMIPTGSGYEGFNGNDGVPATHCSFGNAASNSRNSSWTVTLDKPETIKYVTITPRPYNGCDKYFSNDSSLGTFTIFFTGLNSDGSEKLITSWNNLKLDPNYFQESIIFNDSVKGLTIPAVKVIDQNRQMISVPGVKKIRIRRTDLTGWDSLQFSEFQAFAIVNDSSSGGGNVPTTPTLSEVKINSNNIQGLKTIAGGSINYWVNIGTSADQIPEMTMNRLLNSINGTAVTQTNLSSLFSEISVKRALNCGDVSTEAVNTSTTDQINIPVPQSKLNKYCLNISAKTKEDAGGSYEFEIEMKDPGGLSAGKHKASFEIEKRTP